MNQCPGPAGGVGAQERLLPSFHAGCLQTQILVRNTKRELETQL